MSCYLEADKITNRIWFNEFSYVKIVVLWLEANIPDLGKDIHKIVFHVVASRMVYRGDTSGIIPGPQNHPERLEHLEWNLGLGSPPH